MNDDDSQLGAGREPQTGAVGSDPTLPQHAGTKPPPPGPIATSPTHAIRRRAQLPSLSPEAAAYAAEAYAPTTIAAYQADCAHFERWCATEGRVTLPADLDTITRYIVAHGEKLGRATLARRLVGIGFAHRVAGEAWVGTHPLVKATLRGVLRKHGRPARQAAALMTEEVRLLVATCDKSLTGLRDRALLLVGYAGGLRRSELVAITREDIEEVAGGLRFASNAARPTRPGRGPSLVSRSASTGRPVRCARCVPGWKPRRPMWARSSARSAAPAGSPSRV